MKKKIIWGKSDREALDAFLGSNAYRLAFLVHETPVSLQTLLRVWKGHHDPGALLSARLRSMLADLKAGKRLPHDPGLL